MKKSINKLTLTLEIELDGEYPDNPLDLIDIESAVASTDPIITKVSTKSWE